MKSDAVEGVLGVQDHQLSFGAALAAEGRSGDSISTMDQIERPLPQSESDFKVGVIRISLMNNILISTRHPLEVGVMSLQWWI